MKSYQSELPMATAIKAERVTTQAPRPRPIIPTRDDFARAGHQLRTTLTQMFSTGFWYCEDCRRSTERVESDQGQPAKCGRCGSVRIEWKKPIVLADGSQLIQPGELGCALPLLFARGGFGHGGGAAVFVVLAMVALVFVVVACEPRRDK